jgi:hypothetical protein
MWITKRVDNNTAVTFGTGGCGCLMFLVGFFAIAAIQWATQMIPWTTWLILAAAFIMFGIPIWWMTRPVKDPEKGQQ